MEPAPRSCSQSPSSCWGSLPWQVSLAWHPQGQAPQKVELPPQLCSLTPGERTEPPAARS